MLMVENVIPVGIGGEAAADKFTVSLNPPVGETVTVYLAVLPALTLLFPGDAERVKSPTVAFTDWVIAAEVLPVKFGSPA